MSSYKLGAFFLIGIAIYAFFTGYWVAGGVFLFGAAICYGQAIEQEKKIK